MFYRSETKAQTTSPVAEQTQTAAPQATVPTPTATAKKDTGPDGTRFYGVNSNKLGSMVGCPKGQLSGQPIHHAPSNYLPEFQTICILNSFNTVDLAQTHIETFDSWKDEKPQLNIAAHTGGTFQSAAYGPGWIIESQDPTIAGIVVDVLGSGKLVDLP